MIWEIISGFLGGATVINGIAAILVYRQYLKLLFLPNKITLYNFKYIVILYEGT